MKFVIEIDDEELKELVKEKLADRIVGERYGYDGNLYRKEIKQATRDVIYQDKENIIDRVVAQASLEVKNKAVLKLVQNMAE